MRISMIKFSIVFLALVSWEYVPRSHAFGPHLPSRTAWTTRTVSVAPSVSSPWPSTHLLRSTSSEDEDEEPVENPYADPNYPDLEFVNYADPEYQVDQGGEEVYDADSTEEQIEAMREDRRKRNDEFQFQTYFKEILKEGDEYKGEWTVYKTSTFLPDLEVENDGFPRLVKAAKPLKVISSAYKTQVPSDSEYAVDAERIRHEETAVTDSDQVPVTTEQEILRNTYWPEQLAARDFRGEHGIMCVGSAYTLSNGVPLSGQPLDASRQGPFQEYRAEVGLQVDRLRLRIKLDYAILEAERQEPTPALQLKTMTVCREMRDGFPLKADPVAAQALFGDAGAPGGLYDPPPVGTEEQAGQYMLLDLEGQATLLFPYKLEQDPKAHEGGGWVTSLDWTPGNMRYQVDRKVKGGADLLCLRTLELSEVQSWDADQYRPRDGGSDMRQ